MSDQSDEEILREQAKRYGQKTERMQRRLASDREHAEAVCNTMPVMQQLNSVVASSTERLVAFLDSNTGPDTKQQVLQDKIKVHENWQAGMRADIPSLLQTASNLQTASKEMRVRIEKLQSLNPHTSVLRERTTKALEAFDQHMQIVIKQKDTFAGAGIVLQHHQTLVIMPTLPDMQVGVGLGKAAVMTMSFLASWLVEMGLTTDRSSVTFVAGMQVGSQEKNWQDACPFTFTKSATHLFSFRGMNTNVISWKSTDRPFPEIRFMPGVCNANFPLDKVSFRIAVRIVMNNIQWESEMNKLGLHGRRQPEFYSPPFTIAVSKEKKKRPFTKWAGEDLK